MVKVILPLLVLLQTSLAVNGIRSNSVAKNSEVPSNCQFECLIDVIGFLYNEAETADDVKQSTEFGDDLFLCRLQNEKHPSRTGYRVVLPSDFVESNKAELSSAFATICIPSGQVDRESRRIVISEGAQISMLPRRRTQQQTSSRIEGTRSILAVQLTTSFMVGNVRTMEDPEMSKDEISGSIFGIGPEDPGHDLVHQYGDCSFGKLNLVPASGINIENGVAEVRLRQPIAGGEILGSLQDDILDATEERVGSLDQFEHVIFCIPDGSLMDGAEKWTAFTYFHSHWSFFQRRRCSAMSVTIHELGHNIGFRHSGFESQDYGDESGYMGFTIFQVGGPIKCFNGHKNWVAGWFRDRQLRVNPAMESPVLARLVTFVDYDKDLAQRDVVLIRVGHYFIQYNRAKGINIDTGMHADKVSITYGPDALSDSEAVAGLGDGEVENIPYRNTGYNLVVEVCEMGSVKVDPSTTNLVKQANFGEPSVDFVSTIDYAWISIYLDNGEQRSQCERVSQLQPQNTQTSQPSMHPTSASPTSKPTLRPTSRPTLRPTTPPPTTRPTKSPTEKPSPKPTPDGSPVPVRTFHFSVEERLHKRRDATTVKDLTRLVQGEDQEEPAVRRLKGGR